MEGSLSREQEIAALNEESNVPLEELLSKYRMLVTDDCRLEHMDRGQQGSEQNGDGGEREGDKDAVEQKDPMIDAGLLHSIDTEDQDLSEFHSVQEALGTSASDGRLDGCEAADVPTGCLCVESTSGGSHSVAPLDRDHELQTVGECGPPGPPPGQAEVGEPEAGPTTSSLNDCLERSIVDGKEYSVSQEEEVSVVL